MKRFRRLRMLRRILVGLVALCVALLVAGYAILASLDFEDLRDVLQAAAREATGRDLVIEGAIDLRISMRPAITLEGVRFANAAWGSRPDMLTVRRLELEAALIPLLSGDVRVKRLVLVEPEILLESDAEGRANWLFGGEEADAAEPADDEALAAVPTFDRIELRDGRLDYLHGLSGTTLELLVDRLEAKAVGGDQPLVFSLEGTANGNPLGLEGEVGPLSALVEGEPLVLAVTVKAAGTSLSLNGAVTSQASTPEVAVTLVAEGTSLGDLSDLLGTALPAIGPYRLQGALSASQGEGSLQGLSLLVGDSDLSGNLDFGFRGERPRIAGQLVSKAIHLKDFDKPVQRTDEAAAATSPYVFDETELPLEPLGAIDADLKLAVSSLVLDPGLALQDLDLRIGLTAGKLKVEPMAAQLAGGRLTGSLSLDAAQQNPPMSLLIEGREVDYGVLLKAMDLDETLDGRLDFAADLKGAGRSPRAMAAGLSGLTEVVSNGGTVNDRLFKVLSVGLGDILSPLFGSEDNARLNCMLGRFVFRGGIGQSQGLVFDSETLTIKGGGTLDLRDEQLDLDFDTETREASLASLAVPFRVTGHLKDPQVAPDPLGAVADVPGNVVGTGITALGEAGSFVTGLLGIDDGGGEEVQSPCVAALTAGPAPSPAPESDATQEPAPAGAEPAAATTEAAGASETTAAPATATGSESGGQSGGQSGGLTKSEPGSGGGTGDGSGDDKSIDDALQDFKRDLDKLFGD